MKRIFSEAALIAALTLTGVAMAQEDHSGHDMQHADHAAMNNPAGSPGSSKPSDHMNEHSGHVMSNDPGQGMDHSGHKMDPGGQGMDHSGHKMDTGSQDRGGHNMDASSQGMDHSGHSMDHSGHQMSPAVTTGSWSYLGRQNPEPHRDGRWEMVPVPGYGHMHLTAAGMDREKLCATVRDNPAVMIDRATRRACGMPVPDSTGTVRSQPHQGH